jgi:hypothetical protein
MVISFFKVDVLQNMQFSGLWHFGLNIAREAIFAQLHIKCENSRLHDFRNNTPKSV